MLIKDLHIGMHVTVHPGNKNAEEFGVCMITGIDLNPVTGDENITLLDKDKMRFDEFMAKDLIKVAE